MEEEKVEVKVQEDEVESGRDMDEMTRTNTLSQCRVTDYYTWRTVQTVACTQQEKNCTKEGIRCSGRGSRVRLEIQHDTSVHRPQRETFEPCNAHCTECPQKQQ